MGKFRAGSRSACTAVAASMVAAGAISQLAPTTAGATSTFAIPPGTGAVVSGVSTPSGTEALLWSNTAMTLQVAGAGQVVLHARADLCQGSPQARVTIDGRDAGATNVVNAGSGYWSYPINANGVWVGSGTHTVRIAFVNDFRGDGCDRNLRIGWVTMTSPATSAPATPTPRVTAAPTASATPRTSTAPATTPPATVAPKPVAGQLYVDPSSAAARQAAAWRSSRPADAALMDKLAQTPSAVWFGGWYSDIGAAVDNYVGKAAAATKVPVLVAYNIPQRDCGQHSAGGATDYRSWIRSFASGIKGRPALVVLEPDALALDGCLSATQKATRHQLIADAVGVLKGAGAKVYVDAGHPIWIPAAEMGTRLRSAGIDKADGFALNVSNFHPTSANLTYGNALSKLVGGKHFVIDTSRNGLGANNEWCNPMGRAVGERPTTSTGQPLADAYLWLKTPGESDGSCNGGPPAGHWWPEYGLGLIQRAAW